MWNSVLGKENKGALRIITESSFWKEKGRGWFSQAFKTTWNKLLRSGCLLPSPPSHLPPPVFTPPKVRGTTGQSLLFLVLKSFKLVFLEGPYEREIRNQMVGWGPNLFPFSSPLLPRSFLSSLSSCCQKVQLEFLFPLLPPPACGSFLFTPLSLPPAADTPPNTRCDPRHACPSFTRHFHGNF